MSLNNTNSGSKLNICLGIEAWANSILDGEEKYEDLFMSDEAYPCRSER